MLIDPGSELSFITEELVRSLGLSRQSASIPLLGIGGVSSGRTKGVVTVQLHSVHTREISLSLRAFILPRLTIKLPSYPVASESWNHLRGLQLADPNFGHPEQIHIILGADSYCHIIKPDLIKGDSQSPVAQLTTFGWVVSGPVTDKTTDNSVESYHCSIDQELQDLLPKFWLQEEISRTTESLSPDNAKCEEHFLSTFARDNNGRYIVRLPLKLPATTLGDSTLTARRCLSRLSRRFQSDPSYQRSILTFY